MENNGSEMSTAVRVAGDMRPASASESAATSSLPYAPVRQAFHSATALVPRSGVIFVGMFQHGMRSGIGDDHLDCSAAWNPYVQSIIYSDTSCGALRDKVLVELERQAQNAIRKRAGKATWATGWARNRLRWKDSTLAPR